MHSKIRKLIPVFLLAILLGAGGWYIGRLPAEQRSPAALWQRITNANSTGSSADYPGSLSASGSIEATQVTLASEVSGKVVEVLVEEGQAVQAGQVLVRFSDSLLQAQLQQAEAQLKQAQANYAWVAAGPTAEQRQVNLRAAEAELVSAQQARQDLDEKASLGRAQANLAVAAADKALDKASDHVDNLTSAAEQADIDSAQASVVMAQDKLEKANKNYEPYENKSEDNLARAVYLSKQAAAQITYDNAVTRLNNLLGTANAYDLAIAEADKALAQAQLEDARLQLEKFANGPDPDTVAMAEARLSAAEAQVAAARAEPTTPQQLEVAQAQIDVAQSAVAVLHTQLDKLVITAPSAGIILTRSIEPGEVVMSGANLLTIANLERLTVTVYIAEDLYGNIRLGEIAGVSTDSFPGLSFEAVVTYIADQAEFTPRNVQTAEGRRTTVFAVRLSIENQAGKLKPGMPVDVAFGN